jgi:ribosome assembly protein 1
MSSTCAAVRSSFLIAATDAVGYGARVMEPVYQCDLACTTEQLGHLYPVLTKRRGDVVSDQLREGTSIFDVRCYLPVAASFGFSAEVRTATAGAANPQLVFHHFAVIPHDPFWVPTTEEEVADFGSSEIAAEHAARTNIAKQLIDAVRKRKGLPVDEKVVAHANKQRTLAKKR